MLFHKIRFHKMQEKDKTNDEEKSSKPSVTHFLWDVLDKKDPIDISAD